MADVLQGKLIGVTVNGEFVDCQVDATLNLAVATEETDPCKPAPGESSADASWAKPTVGTRSGTVDFSIKSFATSTGFNQADISNLIINGDATVEWQFMTIQTTDYSHDEAWVYSGSGILTSQSINAPSTGESTSDTSIVMVDKPTLVRTHVTT